VMRKLWAIHGPDEDRTIREYAAAERRGEVGRARNTYDISPEEYARRLLADGLHKGWLRRRADSGAGQQTGFGRWRTCSPVTARQR
jgi:hypothetical protein